MNFPEQASCVWIGADCARAHPPWGVGLGLAVGVGVEHTQIFHPLINLPLLCQIILVKTYDSKCDIYHNQTPGPRLLPSFLPLLFSEMNMFVVGRNNSETIPDICLQLLHQSHYGIWQWNIGLYDYLWKSPWRTLIAPHFWCLFAFIYMENDWFWGDCINVCFYSIHQGHVAD